MPPRAVAVARQRALERDLGEIQRRCGRDALRPGNGHALADCRRKDRPDWARKKERPKFWLADYGCWVFLDKRGEVESIQEELYDLSDDEVMDDALALADDDAERLRHWAKALARRPIRAPRILRFVRRAPRARSRRVRRAIRRRGPPSREPDEPHEHLARLAGRLGVLGGRR